MTEIIMICNQKGGVGKTTTTLELAVTLHKTGKKVLVIDTDPQRDLSSYSNVSLNNVYTIRDILLQAKNSAMSDTTSENTFEIETAIQHAPEGFDIIISNAMLSEAAAEFGRPDDMFLLSDILSKVEGYDYILIDCAPQRSPLLYMNYIASDFCIIVTESDDSGINGVNQIATDIKLLQERRLTQIKILGILLTKDEATEENNKAYQKICLLGREINSMPFEQTICKGIAVTEAHNRKMSISKYGENGSRKTKKKTQQLEDCYNDLTKEILNRISIYRG